MTVTGSGRSQSLLFNDNTGLRNIGFQIPISLHDNDNGNDDSGTHAVCLYICFILNSQFIQIIIFFIQYSQFIQILIS